MSQASSHLINTSLQRGDSGGQEARNCFSSLVALAETVETVSGQPSACNTPLKRGVNERWRVRMERAWTGIVRVGYSHSTRSRGGHKVRPLKIASLPKSSAEIFHAAV